MAFPNFFGKQYESASNFLDDLEMAFLVSGRDEEEVKLRAFPLVLKDSAKNWFQNLEPRRKTNWETVKETFLSKYGGLDNPEHLWHRISSLHQATSRTYLTYESQFLRLWAEWEAILAEGERAPNFLKKEKFLAGLFPDLQEKVKGKFPETFEEALQIARVKDRKLEYQAHTSRVEHPQGPTMADERLPLAPTTTPEDPHLELLQRVTNQLDNLSINMVQGVRQQQPQPNNERMPNGPRRQPQRRDYFCYNCGEEGHGMYFCPHPRNFNAQAGRGRQQVTPPRARPPPQIQPQILQNPQMVAQPQVLQRSEAPQPVAEIPPLPNNNEGDLENKMGEPSSSWQNFNFRDDEGSAQGMQALRLLLAKLQEAQANPRLKPSVNNLLMTEDLMLTSTQRLPSSVAPMHLEGGEGVPVMHEPMQANVVPHPLKGPLQTDGAKKKQYHGQERHVGKIREEGDFHDDDNEPPSRSRHKKRTNERRTKRSRRNSSGGSSSSSQSGRSSHGRFPKKASQIEA
ncbi:hypothetical protein L7F22_065232 [Adiantum nelumboides]|nr:hypothetical protein [Adiantum nelumboides]